MPVSERELTVPELAKQTYLRVEQRQELERSTTAVKEVLDNPAMRAEAERDGADLEAMEQQYHREIEMLERSTPPRYDAASRNKLNRLRQSLEDDMTSTMLSRDEMERGTPENVDKYFQWHYGQYGGDQKMQAYRTILQILDPANGEPNFLSISRLRAKVGQTPRRNLPAFRDGFDEIKWEEVLEDNLLKDMDPEEYQTFLELKLLDWTRPNICRELDWSTAQYEAAMERLRATRGTRRTQVEPEPELEFDEPKEEMFTPPVARSKTNFADAFAAPTTASTQEEEPKLRPYDPILDAERVAHFGWPREEIAKYGISTAEFIRKWGRQGAYFYKYSKDDSWPDNYRDEVQKLLDAYADAQESAAEAAAQPDAE